MNPASCPLPIPADHPAFAGHFPGQPIVPGVVLLDLAALTLQQQLDLAAPRWQLGNAKFVRPVGPGEALVLSWKPPSASGAIAFAVQTAGGEPVASGSLTPYAVDANVPS